MPPSEPTEAAEPAPHRAARALARIGLAVLFGAWTLLLLAWLTLHWGILPHVDQWRPQIERQASRSLGVELRFGRIEARSSGWFPAFELAEVVLLDRHGREALRLPRVSATLSARSLLALDLRFAQLRLDGAELHLRRDADGVVHVAGLPLDPAQDGGSRLADWFFAQPEFVVLGGRIHWRDERRAAPPVVLSGVDLVVRNRLRRHELRLDATPPPEWGERFTLRARMRQPLLARAGDWSRWSGTLHGQWPQVDLAALRAAVDLPLNLERGEGALRAWVDVVDGSARRLVADVALREPVLRAAAPLEPLALRRLEGRLGVVREGAALRLDAERFAFELDDGTAWAPSRWQLTWREGATPGGELSADRLDLAPMASVAAKLPLGAPLRQLLAALAPQGQVEGLKARWSGTLDAPSHYEVETRVRGLSVAAGPAPQPEAIGRPGLRQADVELRANERGGQARLTLAGGALEFPGVFEQPVVALDAFRARLDWRIESAAAGGPAAVEVAVREARFANADAEGEFDAVWRTGPGEGMGAGQRWPGVLDMSGRLKRGRAAATARYLPLAIPEAPRRYVERAVLGGRITGATFRVRGDLWDFPYHRTRNGEFRIAGRVEDVTLAYVPDEPGWTSPWPSFTKVAGELVFDRTSMQIRQAQARLWGVELSRVDGVIRDFEQPVLEIQGTGRGPAADLARYVNRTPVGEWTQQALQHASFTGGADLRLALSIPLEALDRSTVDGSVVLDGSHVQLRPDVPALEQAKARIAFTQHGFSIAGGSARVLGGEASFEGGSQPDGSLRFQGQGVATAQGLRRTGELGWLSRLARAFSGQAPYQVQLGIVRGHPEVSVTSTLAGLAIDLPAPLRKAAGETWPTRYANERLPEVPGQPPRDQLRFELGPVLQAHYLRELSGDTPRVLAGGIGLGEALPAASRDVQAVVRTARLDADAWEAALGRLGPAAGGATSDTQGYLPRRLSLRAQELVTGTRRITDLTADIAAEGRSWRLNVEADQLGGQIEWQPARGPGQPGRVHARLARLSLPEQQAESVPTLLEQARHSAPALDIVVDDFELHGRKLGRLEVQAANHADQQWRLNRLTMRMPEARLSATGRWSGADAGRMTLDFALELDDSGAFLERLGTGQAMHGGKGRLAGQVSWSGSPLALDLPSLDGQMQLALDSGQFLKAQPGAARLLSLLSLQSLPRRLALDFRDVFQEGFAFDEVTGDIAVRDGVARTRNLRMRGLSAAVLMEGEADLDRETADLRVRVVPEINAGTASLAYAVVNPVAGLSTFVAQWLLRGPLIEASTREFQISGTWDDPKVERVLRRPNEPVGRHAPQ